MREHQAPRLCFAMLMVALLTAAARAETPKIAWQTDLDGAWRSTMADQRLLLLYVKSDGCVYCQKMERECYADPQIAQVVAESYIPAALHASQQPGLTQKMGIRAFPTTVIIDSKGQVVDSVQGYLPKGKLLAWLKQRAQAKGGERRAQSAAPEGPKASQP